MNDTMVYEDGLGCLDREISRLKRVETELEMDIEIQAGNLDRLRTNLKDITARRVRLTLARNALSDAPAR